MREIWLLPNRLQAGFVPSLEQGSVRPLHEVMELNNLPLSITLGIPDELRKGNWTSAEAFAEFGRLSDGTDLFCCSLPANVDQSGRMVTISYIQIVPRGESILLPPKFPVGLSAADAPFANALIKMLSDPKATEAADIFDMISATGTRSRSKSFVSTRLELADPKPDWMPTPRHPRRHSTVRLPLVILFVSLGLLWLAIERLANGVTPSNTTADRSHLQLVSR